MSEEIDFTIVTPSYNYSQYIREMLDSVRDQVGVNIEHLIYDAGSTDGTLDIIREYDHVQLTVEADKGMSEAINKGFKEAKGKWVMWLNTDDRLRKGALKAIFEVGENETNTDILFGAYNFIDSEGCLLRRMPLFPFLTLMNTYYGPAVASTSAFYRRETIIKKGHLLNENFRYVMDGEFYSRLGLLGMKFKYVPLVLADFRWHGMNLSLRDIGDGDSVDIHLKKQKQYAESRAIKRAYGVKFVKDEQITGIIDGLLAIFFRLMRGGLKVVYGMKTTDCADAEKSE